MSRDRNSIFFNRRTGEVVPAGTDDEVAGKVTRNRDGSYTAHTADGHHHQRVAKEEGAVSFLIRHFRG